MLKTYLMIQAIGMRNNEMKVLATVVQGSRNKQRNVICQDFCKYTCLGKNFVAVVADGAGSAQYGRIGARIICETIIDILKNAPINNIKKEVTSAISIARDKLKRHRYNKTKDEKGIALFAATLVGVVYRNNKGVFFHIGDGAAVAFNDEKYDNFIISKPENGSFSCETYFYTMEDWRESLRFTEFKDFNTFILMSDGLTNFAFKKNFKQMEERFISPINSFLNKENTKSRAARALQRTLSNPKAEKINPDDKTMLWVKCNSK